MARPLGAFFSYARLNDAQDSGRLSQFREQLEREVRVQTGESFEIFQDTDLKWGDLWRERVDGALDATTSLIAILTPGYLKSKECRREFMQFLERERRVPSHALIFPLIYVDTPEVTAQAHRTRDPIVLALRKREYVSWVDLRFEPWTSAVVGTRLAKLARMIADALHGLRTRAKARPGARRGRAATTPAQGRGAPSTSRAPLSSRKSTSRSSSAGVQLTAVVVDPMPGRGDHVSVQAAIAAAAPGSRIVVRAGLYRGGVVLDKPLELIGDGPREDIIIEATGADALVFNSSFGRVANLTLRQAGGGNWYGVDVAQGRLELEDCDVLSRSLACVAIHGGADPRVRRNRIHGGREAGIMAYEDARGTIEDNEIDANGFSGIEVLGGADPVIRRNRIHDNHGVGVYVHEAGRGTFEENDMFGHQTLPAVVVAEDGDPVFRRNSVHHNAGLFIHSRGRGLFEDNDIFHIVESGVGVSEGGAPVFRHNRIHECRSSGVFVYDGGLPLFEDNDIYRNGGAGVEIRAAAGGTFRGNRMARNEYEGVWIYSGGGGIFERNVLTNNAKGAWDIERGSRSKVTRDDATADGSG